MVKNDHDKDKEVSVRNSTKLQVVLCEVAVDAALTQNSAPFSFLKSHGWGTVGRGSGAREGREGGKDRGGCEFEIC